MKEQGFFEFQTPILTASSPEGARDFLVPSRLHPGKFYALPQAPQQFKQLIMVAGFDRYFQIAPCFRDEDARADRSPGEFYQLDVEMSFVTQEDVFAAVEPVMRGVFEEFAGGKPVTPKFPRIPYAEAMQQIRHRQAGPAQPDRDAGRHRAFPRLRLQGVRRHARRPIAKDEVWAIPAPGGGIRAFCDRMNAWAQGEGQPGLGYIFWREGEEGGARPGRQEHRAGAHRSRSRDSSASSDGDAVFFVAGEPETVRASSPARRAPRSARSSASIDKDRFEFCWIVDFPMYEWNEEEKKIDFSHNPFSMPNMPAGRVPRARSERQGQLLGLKAIQYDIVCNGVELSSGAIRNHRPDVMKKAFAIAGYAEERAGAEVRRHAARAFATARRRTAASRPASTASSCCCAARRTCARSCCSR